MLEKCARAIYERIPDGGYVITGHGTAAHANDFRPDAWEDAPGRHEQCRDLARAVIDALMKPTIEMACAGMTVMDNRGNAPASGEVVPAYQAMLQSILQSSED